jgi:hypothetical protein
MAVLITIFKKELEKADSLPEQLRILGSEVQEIESAFIFVRKAGNLMQVIKLLGSYPILYGVQSDNEIL